MNNSTYNSFFKANKHALHNYKAFKFEGHACVSEYILAGIKVGGPQSKFNSQIIANIKIHQ